jgi:cell wall-associated NlpC family hydrolase
MDIERFLQELRRWEGVPFHHQGRNRFGIDCVGLAIVALAEQGITVETPANYSRSAQGRALLDRIESSGLVQRCEQLLPIDAGDVLVFRVGDDPQHVAIALGDGWMIHSATRTGVGIVCLSPMWLDRLVARYGWLNG